MMRRAAAAFALLAAVAAAGLLLIGVVLHVLAVVAGIVSMLVVVTAGWYAVSRRGIARALALIVMVLAVAALATALVFENLNGIALGLAIVAAAASVASARYALRPASGASHETRSHLRAAMRPGRGVLIMNLKSGGGKAERFRLADECEKRGIEPVVLRPGDDLLELAEG
ncbi:MAG TPA: hypothetical protein VMF87_21950, partial [Streptosporangiaceae bacterium]|nr:hypothetical protein [Streptosporangiaceae bacterium]